MAQWIHPEPKKARWQPLRCGLLNIFRYDEQEFAFEDGHLLLRGSNGSGKSRVLALTLPFLFDGELNPNRMEPDRDPHKRVEWNLLMGKHSERSGYSWLELGRCDAQGPRYFTVGCGLSAVAGRSRLDRWFFITERRVGIDFELKTSAGQPLASKKLEEILGDRGEIHTKVRQYRRAVNNRLFQLGEQRYGSLINLLIELRQPQLSRKFDETKLSEALSEALAPLGEGVINDVAEAFRGLDREREELEQLELAAAGTTRFLETYRRYVQVAARRRSEDVRTTHSQYEDAQRKLKANREEDAAADQALEESLALLSRLDFDERETRTRIETLGDSPEMRKARDLDQAHAQMEACGKREVQATEDLNRAGANLVRKKEREEQTETRVSESRAELLRAVDACSAAAELADLVASHERLITGLCLPDPPDRETIADAAKALMHNVTKRHVAMEHVAEQNRRLQAATEKLNRARDSHTELCAQLDDANEGYRDATEKRDRVSSEMVAAFHTWVADLRELQCFDADDMAEQLQGWCELGLGESPLEIEVRIRRDEAIGVLMAERERTRAVLIEAGRERDRLAALRDQLITGHHVPPPAPHSRADETRGVRLGAPLWLLCDFREEVAAEERAGLEAALEAAGLLDAWVTPDGRLLAPEIQDSVLALLEKAHTGRNLSQKLRPALDPEHRQAAGIESSLVEGLLARIGFGSHEGSVWVNEQGRWRVGPLHGFWSKPAAEHIGQSAREANRRKRLREVETELAQCRNSIEGLQADLERIAARIRDAERESAGMPDHEPVRQAIAAIAAARRQVGRLSERVAASEALVAENREVQRQARARRDDDARDLGLSDHVAQIEILVAVTHGYGRALVVLQPVAEKHLANLENRTMAQTDLKAAQGERDLRSKELVKRTAERVEAASRFETLQRTHGKSIEEVRRQLEAARHREIEIRTERERERDRMGELKAQKARLVEREKYFLEEQMRAESARGKAVEKLERYARHRLLALAIRDLAETAVGDWSIARAVQTARQIESRLSELKADEKAWQNLDGKIHQTINELIDDLRPRGYEPFQQKVDEVMLVMVPLHGRELTMAELLEILEEQIADRRELLGARERAVLEKHLIGEVTQVLHELLHEGERLVVDMNEELASRPTSSGLTLKFDWRTVSGAPPSLIQACKLLMRAGGTWSPSEREMLGRFLQQRIDAARQAMAVGNWYDHLREALDYRKWYQFSFQINEGGNWKPLNRRSHGEKSGGEKVTALMLLQLAAAAAHYRSADTHAPRLILLDEAFVGVDDKMRAQCMGLLGAFDLDFIMTSERESGCYATLPGVAICQLSSRPEIDAVYVSRMVWNGKQQIPDRNEYEAG